MPPTSLPPDLFGSIGMDGTQLRAYVNQNAIAVIERQRQQIFQLKKNLEAADREIERLRSQIKGNS